MDMMATEQFTSTAAMMNEYMSTVPEMDEFMLIAAATEGSTWIVVAMGESTLTAVMVEEFTLTVMITRGSMWIAMAMGESTLTAVITEEFMLITVIVAAVAESMSTGTDGGDSGGNVSSLSMGARVAPWEVLPHR